MSSHRFLSQQTMILIAIVEAEFESNYKIHCRHELLSDYELNIMNVILRSTCMNNISVIQFTYTAQHQYNIP